MRLLSIAVLNICAAHAQIYTIQTAAGSGLPENIPCTAADVRDGIGGLVADAAGNLYIPLPNENVVVRCDAITGMLTRVAGTGAAGFSDGQSVLATSVRVTSPVAGAVDGDGNVYIAEPARVRKVSHGIISTVAGNGIAGFSGDGGPATEAEISPQAITVDASGNVYIAGSGRVREVTAGMIRTVAGAAPGMGTTADNVPATSATINPVGVAVDSAGNLYIANLQRGIRKVANGIITTVTSAVKADAVAADASGNLYIADSFALYEYSNGILTRITPMDGTTLLTGTVAVDAAGNVYYAESYADYYDFIDVSYHLRVRKVSNGVVTTVVGGGSGTAVEGKPTAAQLGLPAGVAVDTAGNVYFSDSEANRVRKLSNGILTTVAGNGALGFSGDGGPATAAQLASPTGIAVDAQGVLYIADRYNHRVRKVVNGVIATAAGSGTKGNSGDGGPAVSAQLFRPIGVAVDAAGTFYITEEESNRVRKVSNGIITAAACDGTYGYVGDNVPATRAQCKYPGALAVDGAGNLYFADNNGYVRKVAPNGILNTVAGIGHTPGDGIPAVDAQIAPVALAADAAGSVYIGEGGTIRKVVNGMIYTIAGGGLADGLATSAAVGKVSGMAVDSAGRIWFSDTVSRTIRLLTPQATTPVSIASVRNAASNLESWIAPGEIVVLTGSGLGPADLTMGKFTVDGVYDTQIAGSSVQVNGVPAPMIYASAGQVAAVVPYLGVATGASLLNQITAMYQGSVSKPMKIAGAPWLLGLFSSDGSGHGQAAAVNQDGTLNGPAHPAARGSILALYATGEGGTAPVGIDGKRASAPLPMPAAPVSVTIGGQTVPNVEYAGGAPGEIAGLMQINVRIPENVGPGNAVTVTVQAGYSISQPGITIVVGK